MASKIAEAIAKEQAEKAEADWKQSVSARLAALEKLAKDTEVPDTKPTTRARKKSTE